MKIAERPSRLLFIQVVIMFTLICSVSAQTGNVVRDIDGNVYKTVKIGNQTWMAENLRTTRFNDGTPVPLVKDQNAWIILSAPAFCWYNNDSVFNATYGALYNGFAINTEKLCPAGWHISSDAEWSVLVEFLGGESVAGGKMKEADTKNWISPNTGATNESGFNALPGGTRYGNGLFFSMKSAGSWWTLNKSNSLNGYYRSLNNASKTVTRNYTDLTFGNSVRCIKN
jgi:uncharacterized protein (TIGR02145 family)